MNALFHRRMCKPFGLLKECFMIGRHYNSTRTLKMIRRDRHVSVCLPFSVPARCHERSMTCPVYCRAHRRLSHDVHSSKERFESAADGRWSNRCNCCGLNSKGLLILLIFITFKSSSVRYKYVLYGHKLQHVDSAKYLGVTMKSDFSWNKHVDNVINKSANKLSITEDNGLHVSCKAGTGIRLDCLGSLHQILHR